MPRTCVSSFFIIVLFDLLSYPFSSHDRLLLVQVETRGPNRESRRRQRHGQVQEANVPNEKWLWIWLMQRGEKPQEPEV